MFDIEVDITLETVRGPGGEVLGFDVRWVDESLMPRSGGGEDPTLRRRLTEIVHSLVAD